MVLLRFSMGIMAFSFTSFIRFILKKGKDLE